MTTLLNGEKQELHSPATVSALLAQAGLDSRGIALAVNDELVPREKWEEYVLKDNDRVVVVRAAQGG